MTRKDESPLDSRTCMMSMWNKRLLDTFKDIVKRTKALLSRVQPKSPQLPVLATSCENE